MGCDIHAYIEYCDLGDKSQNWNFSSSIDFGRDYTLFGLIAGVRSLCGANLFPVRGYPDSSKAEHIGSKDFPTSYIVQKEYDSWLDDKGKRCCHSETWLHLDELIKIRHAYIKEQFELNEVTDPELWKQLVDTINVNWKYDSVFSFSDYENVGLCVAISTMRSIEQNFLGYKTRFVCWFDS